MERHPQCGYFLRTLGGSTRAPSGRFNEILWDLKSNEPQTFIRTCSLDDLPGKFETEHLMLQRKLDIKKGVPSPHNYQYQHNIWQTVLIGSSRLHALARDRASIFIHFGVRENSIWGRTGRMPTVLDSIYAFRCLATKQRWICVSVVCVWECLKLVAAMKPDSQNRMGARIPWF